MVHRNLTSLQTSYSFLPSHWDTHTHTLLRCKTDRSRSAHLHQRDKAKMSGLAEDDPGKAGDYCRSETVRVVIRGVRERRDFSARGDCTIGQLKWSLSERLGASAEELVLIHSGRALTDSELMSHLKGQNGSVSLCMIQRPQLESGRLDDPASETVKSELLTVPDTEENLTQTPTSPLCLVEDLENSSPGFFPALQSEMEKQLLGDPEMMHRVLRSSLVQDILSTSSPRLTRQLILSNPQIQQLLQTDPEVEGLLNNADIINQVLEVIREPDMIDEMLQNEDGDLEDLFESTTAATETNIQPGLKPSQTPEETVSTPALSSDSTDPLRGLIASPKAGSGSQRTTAGLQSLLEEITACPGLMEGLLSGPYVSSLLNCLSQNPDLAAQMLLSHPLFSGNAQLQQQIRQQIPLFLQQMQSPELLSAMFNPRAMEALLQIQQGLQTLAAEAPSLLPMAGLGTSGASVNAAPECDADTAPDSQSGCSPHVATVTEQQQQQFVHQMLQELANSDNQLHHEEEELNSVGLRRTSL
ncbi:ubiquilin-1 [Austrofundulus limnaeus]|uniref:Ubiquilin-1 n=1 Tax=Austrofundulus limnaeus TaxID=52670 RepID=A0A2I4C871_AUSLI|nr:PREDICTED: ubiquilin-1 [Austrofundulus limnaeus]